MIQHETWTSRDGSVREVDQEYIFAVHGPVIGVEDALLGHYRTIEGAKAKAQDNEDFQARFNGTTETPLEWENRPAMTAFARSRATWSGVTGKGARYLIIRHKLDD